MKYLTIVIAIFTSALLANSTSSHETKMKTADYYSSEIVRNLNFPFSEAVQVGDIIYLSGQIGMNTNTGKVVEGGIKPETKQAMDNIKNTLEALGYSMKNIVKCTIMLADITEWKTFNEVYVTYFSKPFPARSAFGTSGLAFNSRVEVDCMAVVGI